jgi:hypothetical protein
MAGCVPFGLNEVDEYESPLCASQSFNSAVQMTTQLTS